MDYRFYTLDVFTAERFGGNPLAVLPDARGLDGQAMQRVAREFNLSETTFVLPPDDPENTAHVRIFTPMAELPFAGHPTVGTAILLAEQSVKGEGSFERDVRLEEQVGLLRVKVTRDDTGASFAQFTNAVLPRLEDGQPEAADVARALSVSADDIAGSSHQPLCVNAGNSFLFVPLGDLDAVGRAAIDRPAWDAIMGGKGRVGAYVYCTGGESAEASYHARMLSTDFGIPEDPATGSAAATFPGQVVANETLADGTHYWLVEQGYEMGRPSQIHIEVDMADGSIAAVRVGGTAVRVSEGVITV